MEKQDILEQLTKKLEEITLLVDEEAYSAKYQIWDNITSRILESFLVCSGAVFGRGFA